MAKNFFPHDSNARYDEKILRLRMNLGAVGYGVYFMLIERLREDPKQQSSTDYDAISFDLQVDSKIIKEVVENYELFTFTEDNKYFYSESLNKRVLIPRNTAPENL